MLTLHCNSTPSDTLEVCNFHGVIRMYQRADSLHLSVKDAKALRKELKKIIKEIEANGQHQG